MTSYKRLAEYKRIDDAVNYWRVAVASREESGANDDLLDSYFPGEDDVEDGASSIPIHTVVELSCPVCQAPMSAKLMDKVRFIHRTEDFYMIISKECDCPEVYFQRKLD